MTVVIYNDDAGNWLGTFDNREQAVSLLTRLLKLTIHQCYDLKQNGQVEILDTQSGRPALLRIS